MDRAFTSTDNEWEIKLVKGVIFNFGKVGILKPSGEYQVRYIREKSIGSIVDTHYDSDLVN